jgi:hypothetical protein
MFKKLILALGFCLLAASASAQTCPTRPVGDNSNACASTAFVNQNPLIGLTLGPHLSLGGTTLSTDALGTGILATQGDIATALPSLTTSQLYGGTGAVGATQAVSVGAGLSLSAGTLTATGAAGVTGPGSSVNNDIATFNGISGVIIKDSGLTPQTAVGAYSYGGLVNKLRNGTFDTWQRGTGPITVTTAGAYTADGWSVLPTGASVTVSAQASRSLTVNSLQVTGATSVTDVQVRQVIESYVAVPMSGQQVTFQTWVYNNTGGAITPTLTAKHPTVQDNYGSFVTDLNAVSLQSAANGTWTQVAYSWVASASSVLGMEIVLDFGNNFSTNGKSIKIVETDLRVTPGVTTGLVTTPPPSELRPIFAELPFNQRYYQFGSLSISGYGVNTASFGVTVGFGPNMRSTPTMAITNTFATACSASVNLSNTSAQGFADAHIINTTSGAAFIDTWTASAEIAP